jgi:hypothetical protein
MGILPRQYIEIGLFKVAHAQHAQKRKSGSRAGEKKAISSLRASQ